MTLQAPAKLNLTLEVLARREDGYHDIRSVVQALALCDNLHFQQQRGVNFYSDEPDWSAERSLVSKAVSLLQEVTGCSQGAVIEVNRRVPLVSGLGGDSSDAATVLLGLNELWGLNLPRRQLVELAARLGSDVPFFMYGGTALIEGRGELVTSLPPISPLWIVLMLPPVTRMQRKTERLYACLNTSHYTGGQITDKLVASLAGGGKVTPSMLFNVFDSVAQDVFNGLDGYRAEFLAAGAESVHLAGSGPALFTLAEDRAQAEEIYQCLKQQGLESYLSETVAPPG